MLTSLGLEQPTHKFQEKAVSGFQQARTGAVRDAACNLDLHLVSDWEEFEALEPVWNDLFERVGQSHNLFQSYNWNWHWCQSYLRSDPKTNALALSIVVGMREGRAVMIWPLLSNRHMGVKYVCWMGMPVSQYSDVLIEDGPDRLSWLEDGWNFICSRLGADMVCVPKVREDAALSSLLCALEVEPVQQAEAPYADLAEAGNYEVYASRFSSRLRKNRRRQHRRLSEQGDVSIEVLTEGETACAAAQQAIDMKRRWLQNQGLVSKAFSDNRIDAFFASALSSPDKPAGCQVSVLKVGSDIVATVIGFVCNGRYATHICAYNLDPKFAHSGAGSLLIDATVQDCLEKGLENFDMMAPGDAYKYEWTDATVMVSDYAVPLTPRGRAYAAFGACAYSAKAAFKTVPQRMRRALLAVVGPKV